MNEQAQKKRMSRGCLIGLIVGAVIVVLVLAVGYYIVSNKDDLARFSVNTVLDGIKSNMTESQPAGIDTVKFNLMSDKFVENLKNEEPVEFEKVALFLQTTRTMVDDKNIDSTGVVLVMNAMVEYYPDLESYLPVPVEIDSLIEDNTVTE